MTRRKRFKPGQTCQVSGQYQVWARMEKGKRMHPLPHRQVTVSAEETFPPYNHPGAIDIAYSLADETAHA